MRSGRPIIAALAVTLLALPLGVGCGDDEPTSPQDRLVGIWNCTRFAGTEGGVTIDLMDQVDSITLTITDHGTYTLSITGDDDFAFCSGSANCTESGTYSATSSTITFDDETTFNYSISGNVLAITGTDDGVDFDLRFVRA